MAHRPHPRRTRVDRHPLPARRNVVHHDCKHMRAVRFDRIAHDTPQAASDTIDGLRPVLEDRLADSKPTLSMVRHPDGELSWERDRGLAAKYDDVFKRFETD